MPFKDRPATEAVRVALAFANGEYRWRGQELVGRLRSPKPVAPPRVGTLGTWYFTADENDHPLLWFAAYNLLQLYSEGLVDAHLDPDGEGLLGLTRNLEPPDVLELFIPVDRTAAKVGVLSYEPVPPERGGRPDFRTRQFSVDLDWRGL